MKAPSDPELPYRSDWWFDTFRWYSRRYIRKHFHALRLSKSSRPVPDGNGEPLIFVMNHPAWWDVLVAFALCERFKRYKHYAPIDSEMFNKYKMFARMGLFGIDPTPRGAARFLRACKAIFAEKFRSLWITAQGKFVDVRTRPVALRPGVGFVASKLAQGFVVPVALEYLFWEERTPEGLVRFGEPLSLAEGSGRDRDDWTRRIEKRLEETQDELARESMSRDPNLFEILVSGKVGVGGVYDWWRKLKGWVRGKKFDVAHSSEGKKS